MDAPYLERNPFFVLELPTTCSAMEVERAGQKLLSMLQIGMTSAKTYKTPLGPRPRDEDAVRTAVATLHNPIARAVAELWAHPDVWLPMADLKPAVKWHDAHAKLGTLDR